MTTYQETHVVWCKQNMAMDSASMASDDCPWEEELEGLFSDYSDEDSPFDWSSDEDLSGIPDHLLQEYTRSSRSSKLACSFPDPYEGHIDVNHQKLTTKGKGIAKAVHEYKNEVNAPFYTTGHVACCCPVVKIITGPEPFERTVLFQHPYRGVKQLYHTAEQSQVGTERETLFLSEARKSREYSNVEVQGSLWMEKVAAVCEQIHQVLAPGAKKVNASLYKLLLYKESDFFNRHQDAQHSDRMFATLLFFLPVAYSGGEFGFYKKTSRVEIPVEDKKMVDGCTWVAFYTDVHHSVSMVESGFRVVLNYSLAFEGVMSPSIFLPKFSQPLKRKIRRYIRSPSKTLLAFPMAYNYTLATLLPAFLKGIDAYIFNALADVCMPELRFILGFHKTKVLLHKYNEEHDHDAMFQGVFVVKFKIAQKYLELYNTYEQEVVKVKEKRLEINEETKQIDSLRQKRDDEFIALKHQVKLSQGKEAFEWVVPRDASGKPEWTGTTFKFTEGELGWLGNMTPPKEYYYLSTAIVVRGERKVE